MNFQANISIPDIAISSFQKGCAPFCFIIPKFLTVGRSCRSGSFIPAYRSVVTRCAAISLESPLFHRDWARCSRAENGARWKTSYAPARYGKRVPTRTKVHTMLCARLVCRRFVTFRDRLFFVFVFFFSFRPSNEGTRQIFLVFESVCRCLQTSYNLNQWCFSCSKKK